MKIELPTKQDLERFRQESELYKEDLMASNNFVFRLKKFIDSFNHIVKVNKSRQSDLYKINERLDRGIKSLELPVKVYHHNGMFHIDIREEEPYNQP